VFSVFYHFGTLIRRAQIVLASAFVTYLLPQLGSFLVVHLVQRFFESRLSRMFHAVVPPDAEVGGSYEETVEVLWRGAAAMADRLCSTAPYLPELVRFSRIVATAQDLEQRAAAHPRSSAAPPRDSPAAGERIWLLTSFRCDLARVIADLIDAPHAPVAQRSGDDVHWYAIALGAGDGQHLTALDPHEAREMYELGLAAATENGSPFRFLPELRTLAVFGDSMPSYDGKEMSYA
jgi:hypothetical protein